MINQLINNDENDHIKDEVGQEKKRQWK